MQQSIIDIVHFEQMLNPAVDAQKVKSINCGSHFKISTWYDQYQLSRYDIYCKTNKVQTDSTYKDSGI